MKFVESIVEADNKKGNVEQSYNKLGNFIGSETEKVFAKHTEVMLSKGEVQKRYFVITHNNSPYDPYGIDSHRESTLKTKLTSVSKDTFEYYIKYLQTKNSLFMTRSQRSFING